MIRPVSIRSNSFNFTSNRHINPEEERNIDLKPLLEQHKKASQSKNTFFKNSDRKDGFFIGVLIGALASLYGVSSYKNNNIDKMMNRVAEEVTCGDNDSIIIKDMTNDGTPELILQDKNGERTAFDFTSGKSYLVDDDTDELTEFD